jgi:DNA-binding NtrC family response regulator
MPDKKCVLIYDDDVEILKICRLILASDDYEVQTVECCDNIIEDIEKIKPDIILMDLWMPKIGGEEAVNIIHANKKTAHIPIILFSAVTEIEKISKRVKATAILKKPFDIDSLTSIIRKYTDG